MSTQPLRFKPAPKENSIMEGQKGYHQQMPDPLHRNSSVSNSTWREGSGGKTGERISPSLTDATIMMVDDEPITTEVIQMFLEDAGYRNFIATDQSTEALELINRHRPDVLLLDLMMPGISGFDILRALRLDRRFEQMPVIMLTSSSDAETKLGALELGATDFLAKP
ncbi:MAG: response regulator, partial [Hyphomicrobiales bacterium]